MDKLHYTSTDKTLFWIAGYTADNNTDNVLSKIAALRTNAARFAKMCGCELSEVKTLYNQRPPRYQYMRVFYTQTDTPPDSAFSWGEGHTFSSVLTT